MEENVRLRKKIAKRLVESERIDYEYASAKSSFIEIMRDLTRFKREFNEIHSLRSKIILANSICKSVSTMVKTNEKTIREDYNSLDSFTCKKQRLFMRR